jgi:adenine-specific DNA glycosylase
MGKALVPKSSCCKSKPRCKRCPVRLKRLVKEGRAEVTRKGKVRVIA